MAAIRPRVVVVLRSCLSIAAFLLPAVTSVGQEWPNDVEFESSDVVGENDVYACAPGDDLDWCAPNSSADRGYCWSGPCLTDSITARFGAVAKSMAAQGITYVPTATQFYQGVASGGREQDFEYGGKSSGFPICPEAN